MCSSKNNGSCCCLHRLLVADLVTTTTGGSGPSSPIKATNYATKAPQQQLPTPLRSCTEDAILNDHHNCKTFAWTMVGVVSVALVAFVNSSRGDFVHDDIAAIVNNPDVNGANPQVFQVFSNDFWGEPMASVRSHKSYRPLTILLFRLNHYLGQGQSWPFHGTNMILHGCATFFLGCICWRTLQLQNLTYLMATLLFALHPIHTEAVSGLVGCADLLACNLTLLSFMAYSKYLVNPSREVKWHWLSLCFACGAVLSKETGIMALAINVGYGLYQACSQQHHHRSLLKLKSTFTRLFWTDCITLIVLLSLRIVVQCSSLPEFSAQDNPAAFEKSLLTRTLTLLYLPVHNFWMLLCPNALSYDWQMGSLPLITSIWDDSRVYLALPVFYGCLAAGFMTILFKNKADCLVVAYLFLILPFLPASNLFFHVGFVVAERILYMPSIGFSLLVALGFERLFLEEEKKQEQKIRPRRRSRSCSSQSSMSSSSSSKSGKTSKIRRRWKREETRRRRRRKGLNNTEARSRSKSYWNVYLLALFLVFFYGVFAGKTWTRNYDWNSRRELFRSGLKTVPANAKVHYNYANVLKEDGNFQLAVRHYRQALRLWPQYVLAHNNLATLLEDRQEALHHLTMALNIDPWHPNSLYNMAVLYRERGDCSRAIPLLEKCISVEPNQERAYPLLSDCLFSQNTHHVYHQQKQLIDQPAAMENEKIDNKDLQSILSHLAEYYMGQEKWEKAEVALQRILRQDPYHEVALYQVSQVYLEQNKTKLALKAIQAAAKNGCRSKEVSSSPILVTTTTSTKCIWGPKCTRKAGLCAQIVIQEADILRAMRQYKLAAQRYTHALELSPSDRESELLLNLGSVHHAMGDWELAQEHYRHCLELEPDNQVVIANMKLLGSQLNNH